jgi:hypothetical protein
MVAYVAVRAGWMMLGKIIPKVVFARAPVDNGQALAYAFLDPVKMHIHCFGTFLFDGFIAETRGGGVIGLHGSGGLGMPEIFEGLTDWNGLLAIDE